MHLKFFSMTITLKYLNSAVSLQSNVSNFFMEVCGSYEAFQLGNPTTG